MAFSLQRLRTVLLVGPAALLVAAGLFAWHRLTDFAANPYVGYIVPASYVAVELGQPAPKGDAELVALQWNPHHECFSRNKERCEADAFKDLDGFLVTYKADFANYVMVDTGRSDAWRPYAPYKMIGGRARCGGSSHSSSSHDSHDGDTLVYNAETWELVAETGGCLDKSERGDQRAYTAGRFRHRHSAFKLTVIGAHMPHPPNSNWAPLAAAVARLGDDHVLFMADTNTEQPSTEDAKRLRVALEVQSDEFRTCCNNDGFSNKFDRIFASFGSHGSTFKPLDDMPAYAGPARSTEFHLPTGLKFSY